MLAGNPTVRFACAEGSTLPFSAGTFDVVVQFMCLSSILDDGIRQQVAAEMVRVLKPRGLLVSYDLRPRPWTGRILDDLLRWRHRRRDGQEERAGITSTVNLDIVELKRLYPQLTLRWRLISLEFGWAYLAKFSTLLARMAAMLPFMRSHYLAWGRKPG